MGSSWMILVASSVINLLIVGMARNASVFFPESMQRYYATRQQASLPFLVVFVARHISGPLIGYVGHRFELQKVLLFGGVMATLGVGGCFFAEDILAVTILWGVVFGFASGLSTQILPDFLNTHFSENRTKASGISLAGSPIGGIFLPIIAKFLVEEYGISGTFLISSAILMNTIPAAMLMKSKKRTTIKEKQVVYSINQSVFDEKYIRENTFRVEENETTAVESILNANGVEVTQVKESQSVDNNKINNRFKVSPKSINETVNNQNCVILSMSKMNEDILEHSSNAVYLNQTDDNRQFSADDSLVKESKNKSALKSFRVFGDWTFMAIGVTQSFFGSSMSLIWTIIIDLSRDLGIDRDREVYFLIVLPAVDVIARTSLGWITDGKHMTLTKYSILCFSLMGLVMIFFAWSSGFVTLMCSVVLFSFVSGGLAIAFPVVVQEFIQEDCRTMAIASRNILLGPFNLASSPLIGYFRGNRGSYSGLLYILAIGQFTSAAIAASIPYLARRRDSKLLKDETSVRSTCNS